MNGFFDIVIMGDGYKPNQSNLYLQHANLQITALKTIAPFSLRADIRYTIIPLKDVKGGLGCNYNGTFADGTALVCNPDRIKRALNGTRFNRLIILVAGKGHGGCDGQIITSGLGNFARGPACTFEEAAFWGKGPHELGHSFLGPGHLMTVANKMFTCTNGCCEVWNKPFTLEQQSVINDIIDKEIAT